MPKIIKNGKVIGSSPSALSGLLDTDITTPTANQVLAYDGDDWSNKSLKDYFVTERKSYGVTFDNYYTSGTLDIAKSGYTPLGIVGFQTNTVSSLFFRCNLDIPNNTIYFGLVARDGTSPTPGTVTAYIDVLYIKN